MGKKGKGRQSLGYGSKSQRATQKLEWQEQAHQAVQWHSQYKRSTTIGPVLPSQRPRLTRLGQLKGILRERMSQENYELLERRRRDGFVPSRSKDKDSSTPIRRAEAHPPGWILEYADVESSKQALHGEEPIPASSTLLSASGVESLQSKCLTLLSRYILEYLETMGKEELHAVLSLLPPETLAALSVSISKGVGMSDDLAYAVGKHAHVEALCVRSATKIDRMFTDQGLLELVPRLPSSSERGEAYEETWEDWEEAYNDDSDDDTFQKRQDLVVDPLQLDGVNVGLKRLELIDCLYISAEAVLALLEKCACITHLSLAGSIQVVEDGIEVIQSLPEMLPALKVLDVTRCGWMSTSILGELRNAYSHKYSYREAPVVHCQDCFLLERVVATDDSGNAQDW